MNTLYKGEKDNNNSNNLKTLNKNTAYVEYKNKSDSSNNRGDWNRLEIIQKAFEQHNWTARHQGTIENSHTGHYARASDSTNVKD